MKLKLKYFFSNCLKLLYLFNNNITESKRTLKNRNNADSEIHLVLGAGCSSIISDYYWLYNDDYDDNFPIGIIINGEEKEYDGSVLCFEGDKNYITLKYNVQIKSCSHMFSYVDKIIEIDLSYFDMSQVKYISSMFDGCYNLKYVNFSNVDLSSLEYLDNLFSNCENL